jgi:HAD superfamily hydrolase (TIGR01509 family)
MLNGEPNQLLAIFDHDGVLIDSLRLHQDAWLVLGEETKLPLTAEFIHQTFGMTNPAIFRLLCGDTLTDAEIERYGVMKEECYRSVARGRIALMDGVSDLLSRLAARGFGLAVGTSGPRANIELTIAESGLTGMFRAIAALEDISRSKPDPEVFLVAARMSGIDARRSAVFEDAVVGIQAAKAAGMWAVGVTTTRSADDLRAAGADQVVETLAGFDVEELAERLRGR